MNLFLAALLAITIILLVIHNTHESYTRNNILADELCGIEDDASRAESIADIHEVQGKLEEFNDKFGARNFENRVFKVNVILDVKYRNLIF